MKIFIGSIATETNTFAPAPTGYGAYAEQGILRTGAHGKVSGNVPLLESLITHYHDRAKREGHTIAQGLMAFAMPAGKTVRSVYENFREELLQDLRAAMPVEAVLLPLHGAMVAEGYDDCEGDLIERVRAIVGAQVPIGVELDLHCHFTAKMHRHADVIVVYKEYPHTDIIERFDELWSLTMAAARGTIKPVTAVVDCHMVGLWHTTREPMRSFVASMKSLEGRDGVLSVNLGHGFPWADVPESGAKCWVVTDGDLALAQRTAQAVSERFWQIREQIASPLHTIDQALDVVINNKTAKPVILADSPDNSGGGACSDSTFIFQRAIERAIGNVAIGGLWDLGAIQMCRDAGVGARIRLRVGGKCGPESGNPVDVVVTVRAIKDDHTQTSIVGDGQMPCGPSVWVSTDDGIDLALISIRQQPYHRDLFTGLGIDLTMKRAIVVKSSQHFYASFASLASQVLYVDSPGLMHNDFANIPYTQRDGNYWPRVAQPVMATIR
jgi:microcystin degradation protein MlrC